MKYIGSYRENKDDLLTDRYYMVYSKIEHLKVFVIGRPVTYKTLDRIDGILRTIYYMSRGRRVERESDRHDPVSRPIVGDVFELSDEEVKRHVLLETI